MPSRLARRLASSSAMRRSSTSRTLASASALARAERSSSVSVRSTTPELLRGAAGGAPRPIGALGGAGFATTGSGARAFRRSGCITRAAALAALFDHHLLGAAVAETLAHGAGLDAWLQRQGLARHTQSLVARRFRINHSLVLISFTLCAMRTVIECIQSVRILCRPGRLVVVRHPVSDQHLATRQEGLARRAREQRSMYHI